MAAPMPRDLATAVAQGDTVMVKKFIVSGADVNKRSRDGMTPLSIAAFWGYSEIAKILLQNGADVNGQNSGTKWSPLHCAAFQGHGPVIMKIFQNSKPDVTLRDMRGRTAADFASALDSIWSFFAVAGCSRTSKENLIQMDIVQKVNHTDPAMSPADFAHFSRPGSSYAMRSQMPMASYQDPNMEVAAITGDVLASLPEEPERAYTTGNSLTVWDN